MGAALGPCRVHSHFYDENNEGHSYRVTTLWNGAVMLSHREYALIVCNSDFVAYNCQRIIRRNNVFRLSGLRCRMIQHISALFHRRISRRKQVAYRISSLYATVFTVRLDVLENLFSLQIIRVVV